MLKFTSLVIAFLVFLPSPAISSEAKKDFAFEVGELDQPKSAERILILAPHPDDEAIGCAGVIQRARNAGAKLKIVYLTNGEHNEFAFIVYTKRVPVFKPSFVRLGQLRRQESVKAMKLLGLEEKDLIFLGYPDFGTFAIFSQYWQIGRPYKDLLTRIWCVPYKDSFSYGAPYVGENILNDLEEIILEYKPSRIFVSHPADVNGDHKALYLFLNIALAEIGGKIPSPKVHPYLVHCVGWPLPRHYHPELSLLPPDKFATSDINWQRLELTEEELAKKHEAILCYRSQTQSSAFYLLSFARRNELFGDYSEIAPEKKGASSGKAIDFLGISKIFLDKEGEPPDSQEALSEDMGSVSYRITENSLLIRLQKPQRLKSRFSCLVYLFGSKGDTPFADMPKIRIFVRNKSVRVFDSRQFLLRHNVSANLLGDSLVVNVPLALLGNPDFALTSMNIFGGDSSFETVGFRKIQVR